ncbi:MAG: hypothetical protein H6607_05210 [Flavobacteriales bacterium]|nr:hypothetical protein [Flavobacteriales bacterium]
MAFPLHADQPKEKKHQSREHFFAKFYKWMLIEYSNDMCQRINVDFNVLTEKGKQQIMADNHIGTAAILLYEFATGEGPDTRYYIDSSSFIDEIKNGSAVDWILNQYLLSYSENEYLQKFDSSSNLLNCRYQFSPLIEPNTWKFAIKQHVQTLRQKNISQFVLGSVNADVFYISDSTLGVHLWNMTSQKSLLWGLGKRVQRPILLGTITQHIVFELSLEEIKEHEKRATK